ncbi:MAG: hypothetical protein WA080_02520 [Sulfuricurvum sp.]
MMEIQGFVNAIIGAMLTIILALIGIIYASLKSRDDKNEQEISDVKKEIHEIDKVVSGEYIKRAEVNDHMKEIKEELKSISDKLDTKVSK